MHLQVLDAVIKSIEMEEMKSYTGGMGVGGLATPAVSLYSICMGRWLGPPTTPLLPLLGSSGGALPGPPAAAEQKLRMKLEKQLERDRKRADRQKWVPLACPPCLCTRVACHAVGCGSRLFGQPRCACLHPSPLQCTLHHSTFAAQQQAQPSPALPAHFPTSSPSCSLTEAQLEARLQQRLQQKAAYIEAQRRQAELNATVGAYRVSVSGDADD